MPPLVRYAPFALAILVAVFFSHRFLWRRLIERTQLPDPWRQVGTGLLIGLACAWPLGVALPHFIDAPWSRVLAAVGLTWMGLTLLLFLGLVGADLLRLLARKGHQALKIADFDPERRLFFSRALTGGVSAGMVAMGAGAVRKATGPAELREVTVPLRRLPRSMHGFAIVQISDLHVGPTIRREHVVDLVDRILALGPDMIVITGDLVDGPVPALRDQTEPLGRLRAPHGVFFVTGNHEYYAGVEPWLVELERLGIRTLRNERVAIGGEEGFDLAGIDDATAHHFGHGHGADLPKALAGRDPKRELVLLAHQPKAIFEAAAHGVGLQLSGHTHGGQIWPIGYLVKLVQPYVAGLALHESTWIYVSRGTGYWGPPMRLDAPPEVTRVRLAVA